MFARLIGFLFVVVVTAAPALAGDDVPAWLLQVAGAPNPIYQKMCPASCCSGNNMSP